MMKVILFENVDKLGHQGDLVNVKPGYARNYLIPQGLAKLATEKAMKLLEEHRKALKKKEIKARSEALLLAQELEKVSVTVLKKVGPEGKLYGSLTSADVAEKLQEKKFNIDRKHIEVEDHIKTVGEYTVEVKLFQDVCAKVKVSVQPEAE